MLTILHGDDISASRKFFFEFKQKHPEASVLEGEKITLTDLTQVLASDGLFISTKIVLIEQLLTKKKKSKELDAIVIALNEYSSTHEIVLWEGKELEKSALNLFKQATPRAFKLPQTLFTFLDSIKPNNGRNLLKLFHQTIAAAEPEMVFFMMVRHVRIMLALYPEKLSLRDHEVTKQSRGNTENSTESPLRQLADRDDIDELKRLAPWQRTKLEQQAKSFGKGSLLALYAGLFEIEKGQKTGTLSADLVSTVDFFLATV